MYSSLLIIVYFLYLTCRRVSARSYLVGKKDGVDPLIQSPQKQEMTFPIDPVIVFNSRKVKVFKISIPILKVLIIKFFNMFLSYGLIFSTTNGSNFQVFLVATVNQFSSDIPDFMLFLLLVSTALTLWLSSFSMLFNMSLISIEIKSMPFLARSTENTFGVELDFGRFCRRRL